MVAEGVERPQECDISEPLLLFGSCNDWGRDLEDTKVHFCFSVNSGDARQVESFLQVKLPAGKLTFQIVSAKRTWAWRLYPAGVGTTRDLSCGQMSRALLSTDQDDVWAHGRNFRLREPSGEVITIRVLLTRAEGLHVWYGRGHGPLPAPLPVTAKSPPRSAAARPSLAEVFPLRVVGAFCRWSPKAEGLLLTASEAELAQPHLGRWIRHRLCFRMQSKEVEFQIISDQIGFKWRVFPRWSKKSGRVLARGLKNHLQVVQGGENDGHGKNFQVREDFLTVVTLCLWTEVVRPASDDGPRKSTGGLADAVAGKLFAEYTAEDTGVQVAIGSNDFCYPPCAVSSLDSHIQEIGQIPEVVEKHLKIKKLSCIAGLQALAVAPVKLRSGAKDPPGVRVAAMLMLLPSTLGDCPGVFKTYLEYHLLAHRGPRFSHIFVFLDKPPPSDEDATAANMEACFRLSQWLAEAPDAERLRPLVSLLDGSSSASVARAECHIPSAASRCAPGRAESICDAATRGELGAKQILNMERCISLAEQHEIDWLICNLDADEAFVCSGAVGSLFASAPTNIVELQILNHEAVPEKVDGHEDYFRECTLFKRNPFLLGRKGQKTRRCMEFWGQKAINGVQVIDKASMKPIDMYFTGYDHGKAAIHVPSCRDRSILPSGAHRWNVYEGAAAVLETSEACILHYNNCQGLGGITRKYTARVEEEWNPIQFHQMCQGFFQAGDGALLQALQGVAVHEEEQGEVREQLATGVLTRIRTVRDACREHAYLAS